MCAWDGKENYIISDNVQLIGFNNLGLLVALQLFPQKAAEVFLKMADNLYVSTETRLKEEGEMRERGLFVLSLWSCKTLFTRCSLYSNTDVYLILAS